jgi:hypothetical protein
MEVLLSMNPQTREHIEARIAKLRRGIHNAEEMIRFPVAGWTRPWYS